MRASSIVFVLVVLFAGWSAGQTMPAATQANVTPPPKDRFHIYLLMGQSNMVGRDTRGLEAQVDDPRVLSLNSDDRWVVARDPIHAQNGRIAPGMGPGIPFARAMLRQNDGITIGLIPCAVGSTPLRRWVKGGDLYDKAVARAKLAGQVGVVKGVLWHQGESDSTKEQNAASYEARLTQMVRDLRSDLNLPDLPIVVGQLGEFLPADEYAYAPMVRAAIRHVSELVPSVGYADSMGLDDKGDDVHFSAAAQAAMGERFADAMRALQRPLRRPTTAPSAVIDVWPEGNMPGRPATQPEGERAPDRTDARRVTNVSRPTLTVYPVPQSNAPSPAMVVCPGGGYGYVVIDKEGSEIAEWLNAQGFTAIVLKYRVPGNRAGALQDMQRALSVVRSRAAELNLDPKRIGAIGFSAGGNLVAKASTQFDNRTYPAIDAIDTQTSRPDFAILVYPAYLDDKEGKLTPDLNLKANIPPTLILHNEDDKTYVLGSKLYHAALDEAKIAHTFKLYATGGHGYGLRSDRDARVWPEDALKWLREIGVR